MYYPTSADDPATPNHLDLLLRLGLISTPGSEGCQEPTRTGYEDGRGAGANTPPVISRPADRTYYQGETIDEFAIIVTDDDDSPVVTVEGLPDALAYDPEGGITSGAVATDADLGDYIVTITATDGVHTVTEAFTVTVLPPSSSAVPTEPTGTDSGTGTATVKGSGTAGAAPTGVKAAQPSDPTSGLTLAAPTSLGIVGFEDPPLVPVSMTLLMLILFLFLLAARRRMEAEETEKEGSDPRDSTGGYQAGHRPVGIPGRGRNLEGTSPVTAFTAHHDTGGTTTFGHH